MKENHGPISYKPTYLYSEDIDIVKLFYSTDNFTITRFYCMPQSLRHDAPKQLRNDQCKRRYQFRYVSETGSEVIIIIISLPTSDHAGRLHRFPPPPLSRIANDMQVGGILRLFLLSNMSRGQEITLCLSFSVRRLHAFVHVNEA